MQSTCDGFVKQAIERGKHAGYRADVSQGEHKQFITRDNAHSWTPFYSMEVVGPMTSDEFRRTVHFGQLYLTSHLPKMFSRISVITMSVV